MRLPGGVAAWPRRRLWRAVYIGFCLAVIARWAGLPLWAAIPLVIVVGGFALGAP